MSYKLIKWPTEPHQGDLYIFWCPGCKRVHPYNVNRKERPCWQFNGDTEKPTFTPSLLVEPNYPKHRCHLFLTEGKIHYCGDCFHELAGKVVDMVDVPEDERPNS